MGMHFPSAVAAIVLLIAPPLRGSSGVSDKKLCHDVDCSVAISEAVALSDYDHGTVDSRFLTFPKGATIAIYSKSAGSRLDLWSGSYNGKTGFFSKSYVKETTVHHSEPAAVVSVKDEDFSPDDAGVTGDEGLVEETGRTDNDHSDAGAGHSIEERAAPVVSGAASTVVSSSPAPEQKPVLTADVVAPSTPVQEHPAASADVSGLQGETQSEEVVAGARVAESHGEALAAAGGEQRLPLHPTPVAGRASDGFDVNTTGHANGISETKDDYRGTDSTARSQQHVEEAEAAYGEETGANKEVEVAAVPAELSPTAANGRSPAGEGKADSLVTIATTQQPLVDDTGSDVDALDDEELDHGEPGKRHGSQTESEQLHFSSNVSSAPEELGHSAADPGLSMDGPVAAGGLANDAGKGSRSLPAEHITHAVLEEMPDALNASDATAGGQAEDGAGVRPPGGSATYVDNPVHSDGQEASQHALHKQTLDESRKHTHVDHEKLSGRLSLLHSRFRQSGQAGKDAGDHLDLTRGDGLLSTRHGHSHDEIKASPADGKHEERQAEGSTGREFISSSADSSSSGHQELDAEALHSSNGGSGTPAVDAVAVHDSNASTEQSLGDPLGTDDKAASLPNTFLSSDATAVASITTKDDVGSSSVDAVTDSEQSEPKPSDSESERAKPEDPGSLEAQQTSTVMPLAEPQTGATGSDPEHDHATESSFDYVTILGEFERMPPSTASGLLELQLWRIAAGLPSIVQQVMLKRPFGMEPPLFILANLVSLWLIVCTAFAVCCAGRCDNRAQARSADARCLDLYKQLNVVELEVKELQAALQKAEQRAVEDASEQRTNSESRIRALEGQVNGLQTKAESEAHRWGALVAEAQEKMAQTAAELETARGYIAQWQAYAADMDEKLKAALALTPELEGRCAEAEQVAQSHREKSVTLEATISRLEEEVVLLKQERDHLNAEAADRDEKARELEARLQQQDVERGELQAALAARELDAATLRQAYEDLLLAGSGADGAESSEGGDGAAEATFDGGERSHVHGGSGEENGGWSEATAAAVSGDTQQRPKRNVVEQHMQQLLEAAKARQLAHDLQEENAAYKDQLRLTQASLLELQDMSRTYLAEKAELVGEMSSLKRAKDEADMSLKVLTAYFKEKEAELQRTLGEREHSSKASGANVVELQQKCSQLQSERDQLRQEVKDVRDEMQTTEKDLRKRLLETEKKAYDAWVVQRSKERELAAQQTESSQLRQKLLDAELARTKVNESLTELRLQLELEKAKCLQANAALAAAAAVGATTTAAGDSLGESALSLETAAASSKQQQQTRDRPTSRSSSVAGSLPVRPLLLPPPPPPLLSHLSLLPPLRPPLPPVPFGLPPGPMLPGGMPMLPPPHQMMRDPRDRHSVSPPPPAIGDRMPAQHMTPSPDGAGTLPPQALGMDPRMRPMYGSLHDLRDVPVQPPRPLLPSFPPPPLRGVPPFDGLMPGPLPSTGMRGMLPPHPQHNQLPMGPDARLDAFGARPPPLDPSRQFMPVDAQGFLPPRDPRAGSLPGPVMSSPQRFAAPAQGDFMGAMTQQTVRPAEASLMNLSTISNDSWNASLSSAPGDARGTGRSSGPPQGPGAADRSGGQGLPYSRGGV